MKTGVAWIIGIAVVLAAFLIGFFIYKASQNIKAAGAAAGGAAGASLEKNLLSDVGNGLGDLLGIHG